MQNSGNQQQNTEADFLELNIAFLAIGGVIIAYTLWRSRKLEGYEQVLTSIEKTYDISDIDLSGNTRYTHCVSHDWVINSVVRKKHGKLGNMFQEHLYENTLGAAIWVGYVLGIGAIILTLLFIRSIEVVGMSVVVFIAGIFVILGPGNARVSEELLEELANYPIEDLNKEDYSFATLSYGTIKRWLIISGILGIVIVIISPFAELVPWYLALGIGVIAEYLIWNPALYLAEVWFPLAFLYMAGVLPAILIATWSFLSKYRDSEKTEESSVQW